MHGGAQTGAAYIHGYRQRTKQRRVAAHLEPGARNNPTTLFDHEERMEVLGNPFGWQLRIRQQREHAREILRLGRTDHARAHPSRWSRSITRARTSSRISRTRGL